MEGHQEDEEKLISVGTTEASPSSPVQVVYESAGANAAHPLSPGFEFHTGKATEAADTGIGAIDVYPPSPHIELRPENATDPIDTGIVTSPTRNSMLLADSHNPEDCQPLPLHPNGAIDVHPPSLRIEFHPENAIDPIDTGIVRSPTRTSMLLSDSYNPHDSQAFPLPPRGRSRTEPLKSSLMSTNRSVTETAGLEFSDYHAPAELEADYQPPQIRIEHVLEHSDFMPFANPTSPALKLIQPQLEMDDQRLKGLLFKHFDGEEQWLKEAREVLWGSDRVRQEDEKRLISVDTTEASASLPMQDVYENGSELHPGNATEAAGTGIGAIDVHPPSPHIEIRNENATDPFDSGIVNGHASVSGTEDPHDEVRSPTKTSMLLSDSHNPRDSQAFPLPLRDEGGSLTEPRQPSHMSTIKSGIEGAGIESSDYHAPVEVKDPIATSKPIPTQHEWHQRLEGLLFNHFDGKEQWLKEAREILWGSDRVRQENPIENVALRLKRVVWAKYNVGEKPPGRRDLLWVMDPFLRKKKNANPTAFNTFSFRALFGAVLHDDKVASERAAQNASERAVQNAPERAAQNASEGGAQNASERGAQNASERGAQRPAEKTVKKAMDQSVQGMFPIHVAAEKLYPDAVLYLLKWGVKVDQQSLSTRKTALHYAVRFLQHRKKQKRQKAVLDVLNAFKARHNLNDAKGHVPLFHAIVNEDIDLVKLLIKDAPIDHKDEDGDTHLHIAVDINSKEIIQLLIMNGANPTLCNHDGLTPSHIAAQKANSYLEEMNEESKRAGIDLVCTFLQEDTSGNTPLDYAAIHSHESTFWYMWECIEECPSRNIASYKPVLERIFGRCTENIRLATLQQTLEMLPKPMVQLLLTEDSDTSTHDYGDDDNSDHTLERLSTQSQQPVSQRDPHQQQSSFYNLLKCEDDACIPVVNTVLDKCLYGDKVVVSKVLDSGRNGEYPAKSNHDAVLRKFVSSHYAIWGHPTMTIWINGKWNQFGKIIVLVFALLYCLQMLALTTALCLAARPGVTDEVLNYYNTPLDGFRGFVEGVVIVMLVVKIANELQKIVILRPMLYIRDLFVLVNIAAISLLVITIILRAAQSNIQWVFAALAYLMYTMLALEYLSLIYWSSTYIHTLFIIVKQDITKFLAVFLVYLVGFAGAFLLVLQVDRANPAAVQEAGGMASASGGDGADNSTVYVWNTFYLGFRLLVESRSVLNYNGNLGWLAVLFYFAFLLVTVFIMLKVLIAQMLDTYVTVRSNAGALATYHRARFLLRYLSCYEYWRKLRSTRNQTENDEHTWTKDAIIWDGKQCVCRGNAAGCCCDAFRFMKKFAKYLFPGDRIAVRVQSTDSKQEAMTVHNMQRMMEKLKTTIKTDLKEVRRGIRAVQAGRVPGYN